MTELFIKGRTYNVFDDEFKDKYGIPAALFMHKLQLWDEYKKEYKIYNGEKYYALSVEFIAKLLRFSIRTVGRVIKQLKDLGFITVKKFKQSPFNHYCINKKIWEKFINEGKVSEIPSATMACQVGLYIKDNKKEDYINNYKSFEKVKKEPKPEPVREIKSEIEPKEVKFNVSNLLADLGNKFKATPPVQPAIEFTPETEDNPEKDVENMNEKEIAFKMLQSFNKKFPKFQRILTIELQDKLNLFFNDNFQRDFALWEHYLAKIASSPKFMHPDWKLHLTYFLNKDTIEKIAKNWYQVKNIPLPEKPLKKEDQVKQQIALETIKTGAEGPLCEKVRETMLNAIGPDKYAHWLGNAKLTQIGDDTIEIESVGQFYSDHIETHFERHFLKVCKNIIYKIKKC
jgi:DNA-binding transcriptional regulator GbsR (MarR family)